MASGDGARTGLAATLSAAAAAEKPAEQLQLLPVPSHFGPDTNRRRVVEELVRRSDAGRPPGARNLTTRQVLEFVRKTIGDPVLERARWLRHTPQSLAKELGCTVLEAFDRLDRIQAELSRLFYAPLAPVDGDGQAVVPRFEMTIGGGSKAGDEARPPWLRAKTIDAEVQQNQALPHSAGDVSHAAVSHGDGK